MKLLFLILLPSIILSVESEIRLWTDDPRACVAPATGGSQGHGAHRYYGGNCHVNDGVYCAKTYASGSYTYCARCYDCPTGKYKPHGYNRGGKECSNYCFDCPPGTWNDEIGQEYCKDCSTGKYFNGERDQLGRKIDCVDSKTACGTGKYHDGDSSEAGTCEPCPTGRFQNEGSHYHTSCKLCTSGQYQDVEGTSSCKNCPSARPASGAGSTSNADCLEPTCTFGNKGVFEVTADCQMDGMAGTWESQGGWGTMIDSFLITGDLELNGPSPENKVTIISKPGARHFGIDEVQGVVMQQASPAITFRNLIFKSGGFDSGVINIMGAFMLIYYQNSAQFGWNAKPMINILDCIFEDFGVGPADAAEPLNEVTFADSHVQQGSVIYANNVHLFVYDSVFKNNHATANGGIMHITSDGNVRFYDSIFENSQVGGSGAALYFWQGGYRLFDCQFINNEAKVGGAAIFARWGTSYSYRTKYYGNKQTGVPPTTNGNRDKNIWGGGAIAMREGHTFWLFECDFKGNTAVGFGDHIFAYTAYHEDYDYFANPRIRNTGFVEQNNNPSGQNGFAAGWFSYDRDAQQFEFLDSTSESDFYQYWLTKVVHPLCDDENYCWDPPFEGKCTDITTYGVPSASCGYFAECDIANGFFNQHDPYTGVLPPDPEYIPTNDVCGTEIVGNWENSWKGNGAWYLEQDIELPSSRWVTGDLMIVGKNGVMKQLDMRDRQFKTHSNWVGSVRFEHIEIMTNVVLNDWRFNLDYSDNTKTHTFRNCIVDGVKYFIQIISGNAVFDNVEFKNIEGQVISTVSSGTLTIKDSKFTNCATRTINNGGYHNAIITNTIFENLGTYPIKITMQSLVRSSYKFIDCTFKDNVNSDTAEILLIEGNIDVEFRECTFINNMAFQVDIKTYINQPDPTMQFINTKFADAGGASIVGSSFLSDCSSNPCTESPFTGTCIDRGNNEGVYCPLTSCPSDSQTPAILPPHDTCQDCPPNQYVKDGEVFCQDMEMETYLTQKKTTRASKPTFKSKRHAFRIIMRFLRAFITRIGRKTKSKKEDIELKPTYKTKLGSRTEVEVVFPKSSLSNAHRYWRIRTPEPVSGFSIKELQFWSYTSRYNANQDTIGAPEGGAPHNGDDCIQSGHYSTYECSRAFDNDVDSFWSVWSSQSFIATANPKPPSWVGMDFQTPKEVKHVRVMGKSPQDAGKTLIIEYSDDESSWTEWSGPRITTTSATIGQSASDRTNTWDEATASSCDIDLDTQLDSFDISLTEVGDTGVVCRGTTPVTKLELVSLAADDTDVDTYKYYCNDGPAAIKAFFTRAGHIYSFMVSVAILSNDGSVTVWGKMGNGGSDPGIGPGTNCVYQNGEYVSGTACVKTISSTQRAFAALKSDGSVKAWGKSSDGGSDPGITSGVIKIISTQDAFAALKSDGSVKAWGHSIRGGSDPGITSGVINIFSTHGAFAALKSDGSVQAWGNSEGGSGAPTDTGYVNVFSTCCAFAALKNDGTVWVWGGFNYGGYVTSSYRNAFLQDVTAISSTKDAFAALTSGGTVQVWGDMDYGGCDPDISTSNTPDSGRTCKPSGLTNVVDIVGSENQFVARKSDGKLVSWGWKHSDYEYAPTNIQFSEVLPMKQGFIGLTTDGALKAWGHQENIWSHPSYSQEDVPQLTNVVLISKRGNGAVVTQADGTITVVGAIAMNIQQNTIFGQKYITNPDGVVVSSDNIYGREESFVEILRDGSVNVYGEIDGNKIACVTPDDGYSCIPPELSAGPLGSGTEITSDDDSYTCNGKTYYIN